MKKNFYLRHKKSFDKFNGVLFGNTVLDRGLVLAPVIVASYNYQNSLILGLSFVIITFFSVLLSSFISKKIPYTIRSIFYTLIACLVYIPTAMWMNALYPESVFKIGVFLPLLVANSLIVVKSESRFHKHSKGMMVLDLFCHTIGFFIVIVLVGIIRELFGNGTIFGEAINIRFKVPAIIYPFSGFILVGFMAAFVKWLKNRLENPKGSQQNAVSETK